MLFKNQSKLKNGGLSGITFGVVALVACELPLLLALIGLGTFSAGAIALKPPLWVEIAGITSAILCVVLLAVYLFRRGSKHREQGTK